MVDWSDKRGTGLYKDNEYSRINHYWLCQTWAGSKYSKRNLETVKNASNEIAKANLDVQQAEKVLAEKKAALDAVSNADLSAAQANLEKLQQARESAGIDYMLAMKNATGD